LASTIEPARPHGSSIYTVRGHGAFRAALTTRYSFYTGKYC